MRSCFKHIILFLALLAFFGLSEAPFFNSSFSTQSNATEWVAKTNNKVLKCIRFKKCSITAKTDSKAYIFSVDFLDVFSQILIIRLLIQTNIFQDLKSLIQIASGLFNHRCTIENHIISLFKTESSTDYCQSSGITLTKGTIMDNQIINGKWLKLKRKDFSYSIFLKRYSKVSGVGPISSLLLQ